LEGFLCNRYVTLFDFPAFIIEETSSRNKFLGKVLGWKWEEEVWRGEVGGLGESLKGSLEDFWGALM
jgi:hypothetical protein